MNLSNETYRHIFSALVSRVGGVEAAAAVLSARAGANVHKSTVSRMTSGQMYVTAEAITALEDAVGVFSFTQMLSSRIGNVPGVGGDLRDLVSAVAIESGEAVASVISGFSAASSDPSRLTPDERERALAECADLMAACTALNDALMASGGAK